MISYEKKKKQSSDIFDFPLNSEGLESIQSVFHLISILRQKFRKTYRNNPDIRIQYQFIFPHFYTHIQGLQYVKLIAKCKYCTQSLIYFKNLSFQQRFVLMVFRNKHVHTRDPKKLKEICMKTAQEAPRVYRHQPFYVKILKVKNMKFDPSITPEEYFKRLPFQLMMQTKMRLVMQRYSLTESQFNSLVRKVNSDYQISLKQLFQNFDRKQIVYAYAPKNILEEQRRQLNRKKNLHYAHPLYPQPAPSDYQELQPNSIKFIDKRHPSIPNILVIVTPKMKELFKQFGQYVGFDLTFSIIRQRPTQHKQFMVGVFGGTTQSKRIIVYGLIVTNSQTVQAYKFIFTQFFRLMGSCPSAVLTDEQKPIYYALKQLKQEGIFTGNHYFDMFHIMKKFRKSADGNCFQLYRKILHASNRAEYRVLFNQLKNQINNDKELNLLRIFDSNSQKFCFSQINAQFVGASLSNSINQKFHDILKYNLPFETKYIKAVSKMLQISSQLNEPKEPDLYMYPLQENTNIAFLKSYRTLYSSSIFKIIMRQVGRAGRHILLSETEERRQNLILHKLEQVSGGQNKKFRNFNKTQYIVQTSIGPFKVYKKFNNQEAIINESSFHSKTKGKWHCMCEFEQKSGILCSHIIKVLLYLDLDFMNNLHKRWRVKPEQITKRILNFRYVGKFFALRNKHKVRVKGYKSMNRNNLFNNYGKGYQPDFSNNADEEESEDNENMDLQTKSNSTYYDSEYTTQQINYSQAKNKKKQKQYITYSADQIYQSLKNQLDVQEMEKQKQQLRMNDIPEIDQIYEDEDE